MAAVQRPANAQGDEGGRRPDTGRLAGQITYQLKKYFARRSGVLLTDTSIELLSQILFRELESDPERLARIVEALREENSGYFNQHFPPED